MASQKSIGRNWQRMLLVVAGVLVALVVVGLVADEVWLISEPGSTDAPIRQSPHDAERQPPLDLTTLRTGVQLRMEDADTGIAGESCASNDGAAVQLIFHIPQSVATPVQGSGLTLAVDPLEARQLPSSTQEVAKAREVQARWRLEEVRRNLEAREFNIRLNSRIDVVRALGIWDTIGSDSRPGLPPSFSAWMPKTVEGGFDLATAGKVVIIKADAAELEGEIDLVMESGRWVKQPFKAKVMPRNRRSICG